MKRFTLAAFGVFVVALLTSGSGCELLTSVDRTKIDTGGAGGQSTGGGGTGGEPTTGGGGVGGTGGTGGSTPCMAPADCGAPPDECTDNTCDSGMCGTAPKAMGTPAATQTAGDCKVNQCDGQGKVVAADDDTDLPDDSNDCTNDVCAAGVPSNPGLTAGSMCMSSGGKLCDGAGTCVQCIAPADCAGQDTECQARTCDAGKCGVSNAAQGAPVASQTAGDCNKNQCDGNGGIESVPDDGDPEDDGNDCTTNTCNNGTKVTSFVALDMPCGAGGALKCNGNGACVGCNSPGQCGTPANACLIATCVANMCGTADKMDGTACDDGSACSQSDTCLAGACTGANPIVCSAQDQCHDQGACDGATGACSNPTKTDGVACNDGNGCTQTDTCQSGACSGGNMVTCSAMDQCHMAGTCVPATGTCTNPNMPDGSGCNDGTLCTQADTCQGGTCTGMSPVVCSAMDQCHMAGMCDAMTGTCSNPAKMDGAACSDGNGCTQTDTCQAGMCTGANMVMCMAQDECHIAGTCSQGTGMCSNPNAPNGTACMVGGMPGACSNGTCAASNCSNGMQDGTETAVDCGGGSCPGCANGLACGVNADCQSNICNGGTCVQCVTAAQCPGMDSECQVRTCNSNTCGVMNTASGFVTVAQTPGDCQQNQCNGSGGIMMVADNSDTPADDGNQCTDDTCNAGAAIHPAKAINTVCSQNGGSFCNATGSCVACNTAVQCPGSDTECQTRTCSAAGACGMNNTSAGFVTVAQTPGDCKQVQCDGLGGTMMVNFDTDLPDDGQECTTEACNAGVPSHPPKALDTACTQNNGVVCDGAGACIQPLFVLRVGDVGGPGLTSAAAPGFIEERDLSGNLLAKAGNPAALPTAVNGSNRRLTLAGSANADGQLSRSSNGSYVILGGYDADVGTLNVPGTTSAATNRIIGRVSKSFAIDTSTRIDSAFSAGNIRAATSSDGTSLWACGSVSGVHYTTLGATGSMQVLAAPTNMRALEVFAGQLYGSSGSGAFVNVFTVGTGLPTMSGQTATSFPGMPTTGASPFSFVLFDLNAGVAGLDTLYVADDRTIASGGGVQKWTFDGAIWTLTKTLNSGLAVGVRAVAGYVSGGTNVTLVALTAVATSNSLVKVIDDGSASPAFTTIATAAAATAFRGVALAPN